MAKTIKTTNRNGIELKTVEGVFLRTAPWFARKNMVNPIQGDEVLAIIKETEKAVYAIYGNKFGSKKTIWIPKSALVEEPAFYDEYWSYVITSDWNLAMNEIKLEAGTWR